MTEAKLKNCPFCGREVTTSVSVIPLPTKGRIISGICCPAGHILKGIYIVDCDTFREAEKSMRAMQKAVEAWNRRAVPNNE